MTDPVTPEEARKDAAGLRAGGDPWPAEIIDSLAAQLEAEREKVVPDGALWKVAELKVQLEAAQKVIEAARELDWDSFAEGQGKPEVDLSGLWDSLAAQLEAEKKRADAHEEGYKGLCYEIQDLEAQLEAAQESLHMSQENCAAWKAECLERRGQVKAAQKAIAQLEADVEHRDEIIQRLRSGKAA